MCNLDLARRAVACRGWRWLPGMLTSGGLRVTDTHRDGLPCAWTFADGEHFAKTFNNCGIDEYREGFWNLQLPDFRDPATRGCLLQLVREAWGEPHMYATTVHMYPKIFWAVYRPPRVWQGPPLSGPTEEAALVAALEAVPERKP